ncbi:MAG: hypothetical protein M1819_003842 [Sarea resinae]|nr:MAG: hypothetical protein M1819_003842 [Sarea resinae]
MARQTLLLTFLGYSKQALLEESNEDEGGTMNEKGNGESDGDGMDGDSVMTDLPDNGNEDDVAEEEIQYDSEDPDRTISDASLCGEKDDEGETNGEDGLSAASVPASPTPETPERFMVTRGQWDAAQTLAYRQGALDKANRMINALRADNEANGRAHVPPTPAGYIDPQQPTSTIPARSRTPTSMFAVPSHRERNAQTPFIPVGFDEAGSPPVTPTPLPSNVRGRSAMLAAQRRERSRSHQGSDHGTSGGASRSSR